MNFDGVSKQNDPQLVFFIGLISNGYRKVFRKISESASQNFTFAHESERTMLAYIAIVLGDSESNMRDEFFGFSIMCVLFK